MSFKFRINDFALCDGREDNAIRLRQRFLELYNKLTPILERDSVLKNLVRYSVKPRNGLYTRSPYVPQYQQRGGGYRKIWWIGFAWRKHIWKDPRVEIQFQFGIDKDGPRVYGIWIQGDAKTRATERDLYGVLIKEKPSAILSSLRGLGSEYYLWVIIDEDNKVIINSRVDCLSINEVNSFIRNLAKKRLWIQLDKEPSRTKLCSITNVVDDIIQTTRYLLPIYLWWAGLKPREIAEDEAYDVVKSDNPELIKDFFSNVDERQAVSTQRVGQTAIRRYALERYANQCGLCDIKEPEMLMASHIIPWSEDETNRGNPRNVICLCVAHDKLFEKGLLTLDDNFKVNFSERFYKCCAKSTMLDALAKNTYEKLRSPVSGNPDPKLLEKHRERFTSSSV